MRLDRSKGARLGDLVYSMTMSVDGYVATADGDISWTAPSPELHRFHNERVAAQDAEILGRRLYEVMLTWEAIDESSDVPEFMKDFARIWTALPKYVFSRTLSGVEGTNTVLVGGDVVDEVPALKERHSVIGIGGATLAAACMAHDLIDEFQVFVGPAALGGGLPFFPSDGRRVDLELIETNRFDEIAYLRYRRRSASPGAVRREPNR